jgi:ergothioneine biosynthesis protein EgtB
LFDSARLLFEFEPQGKDNEKTMALDPPSTEQWRNLQTDYRRIRTRTESICQPLAIDDYQIQSITETSPPKWHLAHVSWFFETFVLHESLPGYRPFHPRFAYLFNSYYQTLGKMQPRPQRGLLSRPTVEEVYRYRAHVDRGMEALFDSAPEPRRGDLGFRISLGLNHEQQHQELLLMDIKHNLYSNPLRPAYRPELSQRAGVYRPVRWQQQAGGIHHVGAGDGGFSFDNETPHHPVLLREHLLADRFVSNLEYLAFIEDDGYARPELWLADGWYRLQQTGWQAPLYWERQHNTWQQFTLGGMRALNPQEPVCHLSYYEADAYARWTGKRLPREEELETLLMTKPVKGNFVDTDLLHPAAANSDGQWYGDLWAWTASAYQPYPGFKPLQGSMGEYNGKFMANQMVLKGGCCLTPIDHIRASYRNFFYPHDRWACTGLRLAEDLQ